MRVPRWHRSHQICWVQIFLGGHRSPENFENPPRLLSFTVFGATRTVSIYLSKFFDPWQLISDSSKFRNLIRVSRCSECFWRQASVCWSIFMAQPATHRASRYLWKWRQIPRHRTTLSTDYFQLQRRRPCCSSSSSSSKRRDARAAVRRIATTHPRRDYLPLSNQWLYNKQQITYSALLVYIRAASSYTSGIACVRGARRSSAGAVRGPGGGSRGRRRREKTTSLDGVRQHRSYDQDTSAAVARTKTFDVNWRRREGDARRRSRSILGFIFHCAFITPFDWVDRAGRGRVRAPPMRGRFAGGRRRRPIVLVFPPDGRTAACRHACPSREIDALLMPPPQ